MINKSKLEENYQTQSTKSHQQEIIDNHESWNFTNTHSFRESMILKKR